VKKIYFLYCLFLPFLGFANNVDSLKQELLRNMDVSDKSAVFCKIATLFENVSIDTAIYYSEQACSVDSDVLHVANIEQLNAYYFQKKDYLKSLALLKKAYFRSSSAFERGIIERLLGDLMTRLGEYSIATSFYEQAFLQLNDNFRQKAKLRFSIARLLFLKGDSEQALKNLFTALVVFEEEQDWYWITEVYSLLALFEPENKLLSVSELEALSLKLNNDFLKYRLRILVALSTEKLDFLSRLYSEMLTKGHLYERDNLALLLSGFYERKKDFKRAHSYYSQYIKGSKLCNEVEFSDLHTLLKDAKKINRSQNYELYFHLAFALLLFLLLALFVYLFFVKNKHAKEELLISGLLDVNKKHSNALAKIDANVTAKTVQFSKKNKLLLDVLKKFRSIAPNLRKENNLKLMQLANTLRMQLSLDFIEELELRFNQIQRGFFINLNADFPSLTLSERRLCAYIRIDMSSREIAELTHQSVNSVKTAKSRLKKKIGIAGTDTDLYELLSQY